MDCIHFHWESGDGGAKEYPAPDLSLRVPHDTPHSEPVTSSTSLARNRRPGHAGGSWAGAVLDQNRLFWLNPLGIFELLPGPYQSA